MEIALKRRNTSNRTDITHSFLQNRVNGRILRTVWIVSTLKLACISFSVWNAMEIAFKRRNISNISEITISFSSESSRWSHFAHSWAWFDAKNGVYSIRRVKCDGNSVYTSKYLQQDGYNAQFSSKSCKMSHLGHSWACFDARNGVHSIRRVKCDGSSV